MTVSVEDLYSACDAIDKADATPDEECAALYRKMLLATKCGPSEKKLAAQLIIRYFHKFPEQQENAIDAIFELCEDDDVNIRKIVIKELPTLFKQPGGHVAKIADLLVQLLQAQDPQENHIVTCALSHVFRTHAKDVISTLFLHVGIAEEELLRERALRFLAAKLKSLPADVLDKDLEQYVVDEAKKVLQDVTGEEFMLVMSVLAQLAQFQSVQGRQQLLDIVTDQADLQKPFDAKDPDRVDQVIQCIKQAIPYLSRNVNGALFLDFLLREVFPALDEVAALAGEGHRLCLMRLAAELAVHPGSLKDVDAKLDCLLSVISAYMPVPPSELEAVPSAGEGEEPKLAFSELECLLWTFHQLCRRHPDYLSAPAHADKLKDFRKRLQYLARVIQVYLKKLQSLLKDKDKEDMAKEENKLKALAMRTTHNMNVIVKDFLHHPPQLKSCIQPSWKPTPSSRSASEESPALGKRPHRPETERYHAPSGKWSAKVGRYQGGEEEEFGQRPFNGSGRGFRPYRRGRRPYRY